MICKYCGKNMDPNAPVCPHCHNPAAPLIGGNGFWDMAGTSSAPQPPQTPPPINSDLRKPRTEKRHILLTVLMCICLVLNLFSLLYCFRLNRKLQQQDRLLQRISAHAEPETAERNAAFIIPETTAAAEYTEHIEVSAGTETDPAYQELLKIEEFTSSTPDFLQVNISEEDGTITCSSDRVMSFNWLRQMPDGSWEPVDVSWKSGPVKEGDLYCTRLRLSADESCCGIYRCNISSDKGEKYFAEFNVTLVLDRSDKNTSHIPD